ncbi:AraC family transcriptional regulator [Pedobacter frigiditerrae]|uniref:AraC family transcriptional regulator n=1 Tax=Pedobacter frigiditerrae TaxID=2530452 RepID=A0A4R0MSU1_9SPHI|nr:helix-turn-helix domain-containing protein [Pedobacter frigiditerrae]TCC90091.1 AraC family transcriptional regulator [Pedobacter frigiditerrae]
MNIIFYPPPKHLEKYIRYFWSCDVKEHGLYKNIFFENYADRFPRLVFQVEDKAKLKLDEHSFAPQAYLCGIDTVPSTMSIQSEFSHFGISFNPFALTDIFRIEGMSLVDSIIDLNDLELRHIVSKLRDAKSHLDRVEIMCRFIELQSGQKRLVHQNVIEIVLHNQLAEHEDLFRLQKKYKTTERTLERLFKKSMGISPKTFQRLVRFERTLNLLKSPLNGNSGYVASFLQYTDQSHFIKDFKTFTNITPSQFQKNSFHTSESSAFISKI